MNNVYGITKPANIDTSDVDIFYYYKPSRSTNSASYDGFKKIERSGDILSPVNVSYGDGNKEILPGMYNLKLPLNIFKDKGIYTIYIKPREISAKILDVSTLAAYPNIRGIVIDTSNLERNDITNGSLVGYRVEYINNGERNEMFRIITSNNKCEPVSQNLNDGNAKGVRYRFNDSSELMFCTLTPSVGNTFKSNSIPYIGSAGQEIRLINTKFNPFAVEIEMVEHDDDTISYMLEGEQLRNLEKGLITTFNEKGEIYHQATTGTAVDPENGGAHDFKINNVLIDESENINDIKSDL